MRTIVIYSSKTGNTKKVAEAIQSGLPADTPCVSLEHLPEDMTSYDLVFAGYWVDRGHADAKMEAVLPTLTNPNVAIFATLGAYPNTPHGAQALAAGEEKLPDGKKAIGTFICQGAVDPAVIEMMYKMFPKGHEHGQSEERDALHAEAAKHPDANDLAAAKKFAEEIFAKVNG